MIVVNESVLRECYLRSEIFEDFVEFVMIQLIGIPVNTIGSRFAVETYCFQSIYEVLIILTFTGNAIETIVILNPESNIPGLIIRPTVILSIGQIGLESGGHRVVWSLHYRDTFRGPVILTNDQVRLDLRRKLRTSLRVLA